MPTPALYVVREPHGSPARTRTAWVVESRPFTGERARTDADRWCEWIRSQHPKDDVFVVDVVQPVAPEN